ncbi:MAG: VanZ family protein [Zetaproteobacteria bacterium]|nr:VanZ family protein [Zetaproteobacteria bacterium]
MLLSIVIVALLGVGDEYLQSFTATRHADLDDVFADVAGAIFFLLVWMFVSKRRLKLSNDGE